MKIKFLSAILFASNLIYAQDGTEFIVKKVPNIKSMSKNKLKEEIGSITRQAFDSSTSLGRTIGNVKINLADGAEGFYQAQSGKFASNVDKNDGMLQIELADIQGSFSDVISNLVENRGFFKRASRGDLREFLTLMHDMVNDLNVQSTAFNQLKLSIKTEEKQYTFFEKIKQQFCSAASELKKLQEKIKGSKCLKKA